MAGNTLHTMPLKCERLLSSQRYRMMAWDERGVYLQLLAEAWLEGCYLPASSNALAMLIGCHDATTWERIMRNVISAMFCATTDGKYYYNEVQLQIYKEVQAKHSQRVNAGKKGAKQRYSNATAMLKQRDSNQNQNQNQNQSNNTPLPPTGGIAQRFAEFWQAYPNKKDKKKTLAKWKARKLDQRADEIIADVQNRIANDDQWKRGFIPMPTTYINGDRWEDDMRAPSSRQPQLIQHHDATAEQIEALRRKGQQEGF